MRIFARRGGSMRSRYRDRFEAGAVLAALRGLRQQSPARVIVAVPVAAPETCELMEDEADDVVCAATPEPFHAVGLWYEDFEQTSDEEVRELLERAREELAAVRAPTLLIVGGNDHQVIEMNREAFRRLRTMKELQISAPPSQW